MGNVFLFQQYFQNSRQLVAARQLQQ